MKKSLNLYCLRTFSSVRTFSSGLSKHNTQIMHVPTSNGVASSDEITRCITGSAATPPRFARDRGRYCRLLSGHPLGETSRVFKHMFLQVTRKIWGFSKEKCGNLLLTNSLPHLQGDPGGTRTHDPLIKSQLLYQLSYGVIARCNCGAKVLLFSEPPTKKAVFFQKKSPKLLVVQKKAVPLQSQLNKR